VARFRDIALAMDGYVLGVVILCNRVVAPGGVRVKTRHFPCHAVIIGVIPPVVVTALDYGGRSNAGGVR
jgi:hypothetical protein